MDSADRPSVFSLMRASASTRIKRPPPNRRSRLIVDDEEPVRKFVERALQSGGYRPPAAATVPKRSRLAAKLGTFDILVTDLMMPQMTGDELARRLRGQRPALKVLYLTGFSDQLFKEKVTLWQDEAFLDKPCSIKGLLEAVALLVFGRMEAPDGFAS